MIHYFPLPYKDEMWYSILARFRQRTGLSYEKILRLLEVHPNRRRKFIPRKLNFFIQKVAPNFQIDAEDVILNHTHYRYLSLSLSASERIKLMRLMASSEMNLRRESRTFLNFRYQGKMYFCPECIKEDRDKYGETYYHRIHALGYLPCPNHETLLYRSALSSTKVTNIHIAEDVVNELEFDHLGMNKLNPHDIDQLIQISRDLDFVLTNQSDLLSVDQILSRYRVKLFGEDINRGERGTWALDLHDLFQEYYSPRLISYLGCELNKEVHRSWLVRFIRDGKRQDPIRHLLVMNCLNLNIQDFAHPGSRELAKKSEPYPK